jgi:HEAT repeat protein
MLTDRDPLVRAAAARVLGKGDDRHVSLLRNALADEDEEVRAAAAHALGRLGDVPSADRLRAQALQAATEGRPAEALAAFEGLQVMDQTIDRGLLSTLLQNPDPELVKLALQTAAHHIHPDRGADRGADRDPDRDADREVTGDATKALFDDVLAKLSDDASPWDVRLEAVRALRPRAADPRVCKALQRLLAAETDGLVRQVASEALHATKKGGPS